MIRPRSLLLASFLLAIALPLSAQFPVPSSSWHNADGSHRLALEFGGGVAPTLGAERKYQMRGWTYRMGGGYRFSQRFSLMAEYSYNHFRIPQPVIDAVNTALKQPTGVGSVHVWSATLIPTYQYYRHEKFSAYVLGGGGLYRKVTLFQDSSTCDSKGIDCTPDRTRPHFSNNASGFEGGLGISHELSDNQTAKLFLEARYVWTDNAPHSTQPFYLPAAQRTSYLPVTAGVRW